MQPVLPMRSALSAQDSAYQEQREDGSGVIRSLMLDVFRHTWPESAPFTFDRDQVSAYRSRVLRVMSGMPGLIAGLLDAPVA